jgi:hypothetical protein
LVPGDYRFSRPGISLLVQFDICGRIRLLEKIKHAKRQAVRPFCNARPAIIFRPVGPLLPRQSCVPGPHHRDDDQTAKKAPTAIPVHSDSSPVPQSRNYLTLKLEIELD